MVLSSNQIFIKFIRVDIVPSEKQKDLDEGKVKRLYNLENKYIRHRHFTLKFTNSLCLQFFIKAKFTNVLKNLHIYARNIIREFNLYKKNKVKKIKCVKINNINLGGNIYTFEPSRINVTDFNADFHVHQGNEPPVIIRTGFLPKNFTKIDIRLNSCKGLLRIYSSRRFTCITSLKDIKKYIFFIKSIGV